MEIHDRLRLIIEEKDLSISKFERIIGAGKNSVSTCLRRHSSVNHEVLVGVARNFPEYIIEWVITGKVSHNEEIISRIKSKILELEQELNKIT
tara:strand:- start:168 stop:446 length:279 start_codon:yes stop_codon:yes gene_type:complete